MTDVTSPDDLYGLPLDDFTAARDGLAKRLKDAGDKEGAKQVKSLRKPNIAAWALNRLSRDHAEKAEQLLAAGERVRRAQRKLMSGGKRADLDEATDQRKKLVAELSRTAESVLDAGGHATSASTIRAVRDSLTAVATDEVGAEAFRRGVLERELKPGAVVDVGALRIVSEAPKTGAAPARRREKPSGKDEELAAAVAKRDEAAQSAEAAELEAARLLGEAGDAARASGAASQEAEAAEGAVEEARRALEAAERRVGEARERAEEAAKAAAEARERADRASDDAEQARAELARAERDVKRLSR